MIPVERRCAVGVDGEIEPCEEVSARWAAAVTMAVDFDDWGHAVRLIDRANRIARVHVDEHRLREGRS